MSLAAAPGALCGAWPARPSGTSANAATPRMIARRIHAPRGSVSRSFPAQVVLELQPVDAVQLHVGRAAQTVAVGCQREPDLDAVLPVSRHVARRGRLPVFRALAEHGHNPKLVTGDVRLAEIGAVDAAQE